MGEKCVLSVKEVETNQEQATKTNGCYQRIKYFLNTGNSDANHQSKWLFLKAIERTLLNHHPTSSLDPSLSWRQHTRPTLRVGIVLCAKPQHQRRLTWQHIQEKMEAFWMAGQIYGSTSGKVKRLTQRQLWWRMHRVPGNIKEDNMHPRRKQ